MYDNLDRLAVVVESIPALLHAEARTIVAGLEQAGVEQARDNLTQSQAIDTQGTYDGIQPTDPVETAGGWSGAVRATAPQSIFVERGRRPLMPMPPGGVLLAWMARHGLPQHAEFALRRKIAQRGIPARPFISPLVEQLATERDRLVGQLVTRIRVTLTSASGL